MNKSILLVLGLLFCSSAMYAQQTGHCGVTSADGELLIKRMLLNRLAAANIPVEERGAISYVPVHFHLVADSDGTGRHKEWLVLDQLCDLNSEYAAYDIQFYLSAHPNFGLFDKSINANNIYETQAGSFVMQARKHPNAVNIFVSLNAASGNNQPGLTLAYYSSTFDWIVSRKSEINGTGNGTLSHEMGHFLSLPHTFQGWESESFGPGYPGWPTAPLLSPTGNPNEKQDGSNCSTAGDFICDTPPDYNFGFIWNGCTPYTGGALDPMGVLVNPMENNTMSYFQNCADYDFTPGQAAEMKSDLNSIGRNYLDNTFVPLATSITLPTGFMASPAQNSVTPVYDHVTFNWLATPGATHYLFEVDLVPGFISSKVQTVVVEGATSTAITGLDPNKTYYWRARPFNLYATCAKPTTNIAFKTGTATSATNELQGVVASELFPNPVNGSDLTLSITADQAFDMQLRLVDAAGRILLTQADIKVNNGTNLFPIATDQLPNGVYYLNLISGQSSNTKIVSIVR
jgi:hypothetical protein